MRNKAKLPLRRKKEGIKEMEKRKSECSSKHYRDYTRTSSPRKLLLHLLLTSVSFHLLKVTIFSLAGVCLSRHLDNHPSKLNDGNSRYDYCIDFHRKDAYLKIFFNKQVLINIIKLNFYENNDRNKYWNKNFSVKSLKYYNVIQFEIL